MLENTFHIERYMEGGGAWVTRALFDTQVLYEGVQELHSQTFERRFPDTHDGRTAAVAWVETQLATFAKPDPT